MSNIPAEFHFFRKTWFQNPVLRSKLNPTRPCEDRPQSAAKEYWVERRGRGIETAGGSHEKTSFKEQRKRMRETVKVTPKTCILWSYVAIDAEIIRFN